MADNKKIFVEISAENTELLKKFMQSKKALEQFGAAGKQANTGIMQSVQQISTSMASLIYVAQTVKNAITSLINPAFQFSKTMETSRYGMAGILMSMTEINGEAVTFNEAIGISGNVVKRLNDEALRTAATSQELTQTFQAILAPALKAGMSLEQIIKLTSAGTNAVKSLGLAQNQVVQEMRDLVAGGITPASSTLATALGLKDADIKAARNSAEGLYAFLMERLKGFEILSGKFGDTLAGKLDQAREAAQRIGADGFEPVFNELKSVLDEVTGKMIRFNKETGAVELDKDLIKSIRAFSDDCVTASKNIRQIISDLNEWEKENGLVVQGLKLLADNWKWVLAAALYFFTPLGGLFNSAIKWVFSLGTKVKNIGTAFTDLKTLVGWLGEAIKNAFNGGKLAAFIANLKVIWELLSSKQGVLAVVLAIAGILGLKSTIDAASDYVEGIEAKRDAQKSWADRKKEEDSNDLPPVETSTDKELKAKFTGSGDGDKTAADAQRRLDKAERELITAKMEAETNIIKDGLERQQTALDDAKEDGLISIKDYWQKRLRIDLAGIDAEIKQKESALAESMAEGESADTDAERINSEAQSIKIQSELDILRAKRGDIIIANARKLADEEEKLAELYKTIENKLADMTGDTLTAKLNEIDAQYKDMLEKFKAEGGAQYATLLKVVDMEKAKATYDDLLKQVDLLKDKLANDILPIQTAIENKQLDSVTGQERINELTREYGASVLAMLPALEKWAKASGAKPEVLEYLRKLREEATKAANTMSASGKIIKESFADNLEEAFSNILTGAKNVQDAFRDMAKAILADIARIYAKKWATSITENLFAGGGYVSGAGTSTSDSIAARLSNGEYVINAAAVQRVGVGLLDSINYGLNRVKRADFGKIGFASGGYVQTGAMASVSVPIVINGGASPGLVANLREKIEETVMSVLAREARA